MPLQQQQQPQLTARQLRARMHERPPATADDDFATLVDKAGAQVAAAEAMVDGDAACGPLSFVGAAQSAAHKRAARQRDDARMEATRQVAAGGPPPCPPVALSTLEPQPAKINLRGIESGERKLFDRKERKRQREAASRQRNEPPVENRIASLVQELDEPVREPEPPSSGVPPSFDFDAEIAQMLSRVGWREVDSTAAG